MFLTRATMIFSCSWSEHTGSWPWLAERGLRNYVILLEIPDSSGDYLHLAGRSLKPTVENQWLVSTMGVIAEGITMERFDHI